MYVKTFYHQPANGAAKYYVGTQNTYEQFHIDHVSASTHTLCELLNGDNANN